MSADRPGNGNAIGNGDVHPLADRLDRIGRIAGLVGIVGLGLLLLGVPISGGEQVLRSYLIGYLFWLGLPLGCASLLLLNHLAGGTWGLLIRRPLEAGAATIPLITVLFLPIALGLGLIYPWAGDEYEWEHAASPSAAGEDDDAAAHGDAAEAQADVGAAVGRSGEESEPVGTFGGEPEEHPSQGHKALWYSRPFFFGRAVGYFVVWNVLVLLAMLWSGQQERTTDPAPSRRLSLLGAPALILLFLTGTFAMFDWVMSLDPHWYSTIFGAMMITGMGLETFAFTIFVTTLLVDRDQLADLPTPGRLRDLGNLMLAFVMLWAYTSFSQFMLIWAGNLPEEVTWYERRSDGGWQYLAAALMAFHFFLPFAVLLFRVNKERTDRLRAIAGAIFVVHLIDVFYLTAPSMYYSRPVPSPFDLAALAGVGGLWIGAFALLLRRRPPLPRNDPMLIALREHGHQHKPPYEVT